MIGFLSLSFLYFLSPIVFFFMMVVFCFFMLNNYCWSGLFIFFDSYVFMLLVIMSLFILGVVLMSEKNSVLVILSEMLVFICMMFFIPSNMLMLYIYFELSMFPILVMILGYGSQIEKINSAYYLIFYAAFCSFPFLFVFFNSNFFFNVIYFDFCLSWEMVFVLSLSFMMKFPVYFLHLWLPKAHVEAPTTASMLLAGLLLKLGTAGFLRILGSLSFLHVNFWMIFALLGMILAAFSCVFQSDAKSLAAYSSVTHMSFVLMGLVFVLMCGKTGSMMLMLAHGYVSTLMFYLVGEFFHVSLSRMVYYMSGFFGSSIIMALLFSIVFLANSGVPPSLSFISEFVVISSALVLMSLGFWILFLYFFMAFYYSLYLLTSAIMGKGFVDFNNWNVGFSIPLIIMAFNIFWVGVFF